MRISSTGVLLYHRRSRNFQGEILGEILGEICDKIELLPIKYFYPW